VEDEVGLFIIRDREVEGNKFQYKIRFVKDLIDIMNIK